MGYLAAADVLLMSIYFALLVTLGGAQGEKPQKREVEALFRPGASRKAFPRPCCLLLDLFGSLFETFEAVSRTGDVPLRCLPRHLLLAAIGLGISRAAATLSLPGASSAFAVLLAAVLWQRRALKVY